MSLNVILTNDGEIDGFSLLNEKGIKTFHYPMIKISALNSDISFSLDDYDFFIFTSKNGVKFFFEKDTIKSQNKTSIKCISIGSKTSETLHEYNIEPIYSAKRSYSSDLFKDLKIKSKELEIAKEIEELALNDSYFKEKNLYPNVDFYSGILLKALSIPTTMFTPIFAVGRTVGWLSQWKEMIEDKEFKITRPRQLFTGDKDKSYKKVPEREKKSIFNLLWFKKTFLNNQ